MLADDRAVFMGMEMAPVFDLSGRPRAKSKSYADHSHEPSRVKLQVSRERDLQYHSPSSRETSEDLGVFAGL